MVKPVSRGDRIDLPQTGSAVDVSVSGSILADSSAGFVHASRPAWRVLAT